MPTAVRTSLTLLVDHDTSGEPVHEQVVVDDLGDGTYRVVQSPGLVIGTAAGDLIERADDGSAVVLERGGNLCVQVYASDAHADVLELLLQPLGGRLDGRIPDTLSVFTVPASAGFERVARILEALVERHPDVEWLYGNVYDVDGVTPLGWWETLPS